MPERSTAARRGLSVVLGAAALALGGVAVAGWEPATTASPRADPGASSTGAASPLPQPRLVPASRQRPGTPQQLRIPRLAVDAEVLAVRTRGDVLVPPSDPTQVGWWADGARPGDPGRALVAGHTVSNGGGALDDLELLQAGDRVVVQDGLNRTRWEVESVEVLGKGRLAAVAERVFRQDGPPRLVLLTCEDWDGSAYLSNVVVVAQPA